jgi:hypothetical protein
MKTCFKLYNASQKKCERLQNGSHFLLCFFLSFAISPPIKLSVLACLGQLSEPGFLHCCLHVSLLQCELRRGPLRISITAVTLGVEGLSRT